MLFNLITFQFSTACLPSLLAHRGHNVTERKQSMWKTASQVEHSSTIGEKGKSVSVPLHTSHKKLFAVHSTQAKMWSLKMLTCHVAHLLRNCSKPRSDSLL